MKLRVINGPNLNMTGLREPSVYGSETLEDINNELRAFAQERGIILDFFQPTARESLSALFTACCLRAMTAA